MNFLLTMLICANTAQGIQCFPPIKFDILYKDGYDCMVDGYNKSSDKTIELGREQINEYNIFIKFGCSPKSAKPTSGA